MRGQSGAGGAVRVGGRCSCGWRRWSLGGRGGATRLQDRTTHYAAAPDKPPQRARSHVCRALAGASGYQGARAARWPGLAPPKAGASAQRSGYGIRMEHGDTSGRRLGGARGGFHTWTRHVTAPPDRPQHPQSTTLRPIRARECPRHGPVCPPTARGPRGAPQPATSAGRQKASVRGTTVAMRGSANRHGCAADRPVPPPQWLCRAPGGATVPIVSRAAADSPTRNFQRHALPRASPVAAGRNCLSLQQVQQRPRLADAPENDRQGTRHAYRMCRRRQRS